MEYNCISADCHIDLCWLPHELFVSNASNELRDRMPYVVPGPDGPKWVTKSGLNLGLANCKGIMGAVGSGKQRYVAGKEYRYDRIATTGLYSDCIEGKFRPTTPALRLEDQDRDQIQAEVLYGLLGAGNKMTDREATIEFYRIYNEWLSNFCSYNPQRLIGLASIPSSSVDAAVAEARRVSKFGLGGVDLSVVHGMTPLSDPLWDPFWKAASDANMPVHFHTIGPRPEPPVREDLPETIKKANEATRMAAFSLNMAAILAGVIHGGALERFPDLRIVLGESGIGWIPYVLQRMDSEYESRYSRYLPLKMKPSQYWQRQCRATFQDDVVGVTLVDFLGVENIMWASDFPHGDSIFPDSQDFIKRQLSNLPAASKRKIICENAAKFYGLI